MMELELEARDEPGGAGEEAHHAEGHHEPAVCRLAEVQFLGDSNEHAKVTQFIPSS